MIHDTITKLEARLREVGAAQDPRHSELLTLLARLKSEVGELSKTHGEQAESIAGFAHVSTHEATRETKNPDLIDFAVKGLASSVEGFEESHPGLVSAVNAICNTLAGLGI